MECQYTGCDCYYCKRKNFIKNSACKYYTNSRKMRVPLYADNKVYVKIFTNAYNACYKKSTVIGDMIYCDKFVSEDLRKGPVLWKDNFLGWARLKILKAQVKWYLFKGYISDRILRR